MIICASNWRRETCGASESRCHQQQQHSARLVLAPSNRADPTSIGELVHRNIRAACPSNAAPSSGGLFTYYPNAYIMYSPELSRSHSLCVCVCCANMRAVGDVINLHFKPSRARACGRAECRVRARSLSLRGAV